MDRYCLLVFCMNRQNIKEHRFAIPLNSIVIANVTKVFNKVWIIVTAQMYFRVVKTCCKSSTSTVVINFLFGI